MNWEQRINRLLKAMGEAEGLTVPAPIQWLADRLGVTKQAIYQWRDCQEPTADNQRKFIAIEKMYDL